MFSRPSSHPSRVRGLKFIFKSETEIENGKSHPSRVRGLKSHTVTALLTHIAVAPFTGAWIEISLSTAIPQKQLRRTLHGCVD